VHQALPAIIFAALRRFRGSVLFHGPRPSSSQGAPFWPSGLTVRRSRPPTAAAELRALVPSPAICRPLLIPRVCLSQRFFLWGLGRSPGFACWLGASFKHFWPLALASQALPAIILAALRRFHGPALFRGSRPSSSPGAPLWPSGLTLQSSGPAFCGPLTLAVSFYGKSQSRRLRWSAISNTGCGKTPFISISRKCGSSVCFGKRA